MTLKPVFEAYLHLRAILFSLLLMFVAANAGAVASQRDLRRWAAMERCEQFLASRGITIPELSARRLIQEVAPLVYTFDTHVEQKEIEIASLERYLRYKSGQVISIGNFAEMKGVPAVDAIYFPADEGESFNISVKWTAGNSKNGSYVLWSYLRAAEKSIAQNYSAEHFAKLYLKTYDNLKYNTVMYKSLTKLLGLNTNVNADRKVMILIDASESPWRPHFEPVGPLSAEFNLVGHPDDTTLRVLDYRVEEYSISHPKRVNISQMVRRLGESPSLKGYAIIFRDGLLEIDREGYRLQIHPSQ